jgi:Response regulator containing CheY-like receiver, AAA-type ATPase, and DNA-binding domains
VAILVVDDDAGLRRALRRVLVSHGFEVEAAVDGADALDQLRARPFDLVVLDVMMPGPTASRSASAFAPRATICRC